MRYGLVVLLTALVARAAAAVPVCTAGDIAGVDPGCPLQGTCTITRDIEVSGDCTLDFGSRPVFLDTNRTLSLLHHDGPLSSYLTITAGSFTMRPGALIGGDSGDLELDTAADVVLQPVDLSGNDRGGARIFAGGHVYLQGPFVGGIEIYAGGDLVTTPGAVIAGGASLTAAGEVDLGDVVDVAGGGGSVTIHAGGDITLRGVHGDAAPSEDPIPGTSLELVSEGNVRIVDTISLRGASGPPVDGLGSDGGSFYATAAGNLSIEAPILLDGGFPLNAPGRLYIEAGGAITVAAGGPISARTRGANEDGFIRLTAGSTITVAARIDATGGPFAKPIEIEAAGDIAVTAPIDNRAFPLAPDTAGFDCPYGGSIHIFTHAGSLFVGAPLYTTGPGSGGWDIGLTGCDVTVASSGLLSTGQDFPGSINIAASGQLRFDGRATAEVYRPNDLGFGEITLEFPEDRPPLFGSNSEMHPAPDLVPGGNGDIGPCPRCGDGKVDGDEQCDDGNLIDCDGCDGNCMVSSTCPLPTPTPTTPPTPTLAAPGIVCAGAGGSTDLGCPVLGACTLTRDIAITGICTLDAGKRPLSVGTARTIHIAPGGDLTVKAGSFTMQPGAFIDGRGQTSTVPDNRGASLRVMTEGDVVLQRRGVTQARIDMSAASFPGRIDIQSGGSVDLGGPLTAKRTMTRAAEYGVGGFVRIDAAGAVNVGELVDVTNVGGGGAIIIAAGSDVAVHGLQGNGGGSVDISAGRNVQILDGINLLGNASGSPQPSPFGGILYIRAPGDISIAAPISVDGTSAGGEGHIAIAAGGSINVAAGAHLFARGFGDFVPDEDGYVDPCVVLGGGSIDLRAGSTITTAARIDASADSRGGQVDLHAGGDIAVHAPIDVTGYHAQGYGGRIEVAAGQGQQGGAVVIDQALYADGGRFPQPLAGVIDLQGCEVTVTPAGVLAARAPGNGGNISINARASLHVDGFVTAKAITSGSTEIQDGVISFVVPAGRPPEVGAHGSVLPAAGIQVADGCDSTCRLSNTCPPPTLTPTPTEIAVGSATATVTPTATLIAPETASPTPTTPTPTPPLIACAGDCDASGEVSVDELTRGVRIALGADLLSACPAFDMNGNAEITIDELIQGLNNALNGCLTSAYAL